MPKIIHLIRHGEAEHNVERRLHIHDPILTPLGESQCRKLAKTFPYHSRVQLIVTSPLKRTVQTTLIGLKPCIDRGITPVLAVPEFQETGEFECDKGSKKEVLVEMFKDEPVDFERCVEGWNDKQGIWATKNVPKRAELARQFLKNCKEDEIVVVCHGGFLHYLSNDWNDFDEYLGTAWRNTEFRSYKFKSEEADMLDLEETDESKEWRKRYAEQEEKKKMMNGDSKDETGEETVHKEVEDVEKSRDVDPMLIN